MDKRGAKTKRQNVRWGFLLAFVWGSFWSSFGSANPSAQLPVGGKIAAGKGTITTNADQVVVDQQTPSLAINWDSFNLGRGKTITFNQGGNQKWVALNRIQGGPSLLEGTMNAHGHIILSNPRGITFGDGFRFNGAGLVAATLDMNVSDFMKGQYRFHMDPTLAPAPIIIKGDFTMSEGGLALFVAPQIRHQGVIIAPAGGRVKFGVAEELTVDFWGDGLVNWEVSQELTRTVQEEGSTDMALIESSGRIDAPEGAVVMSARAAKEIINSAINVTGDVSATTATMGKNGVILLDAGPQHDVSIQGATLDVSATKANVDAGSVIAFGRRVEVDGATNVRAEALAQGKGRGGDILFGGPQKGDWRAFRDQYKTKHGKVYQGPQYASEHVGIAEGATLSVEGGYAKGGKGGDIVFFADGKLKVDGMARGVSFKGTANIQGYEGGLIEFSARHGGKVGIDQAVARIMLSNALGGQVKPASIVYDPDIVILGGTYDGVHDFPAFYGTSGSNQEIAMNGPTVAAFPTTADLLAYIQGPGQPMSNSTIIAPNIYVVAHTIIFPTQSSSSKSFTVTPAQGVTNVAFLVNTGAQQPDGSYGIAENFTNFWDVNDGVQFSGNQTLAATLFKTMFGTTGTTGTTGYAGVMPPGIFIGSQSAGNKVGIGSPANVNLEFIVEPVPPAAKTAGNPQIMVLPGVNITGSGMFFAAPQVTLKGGTDQINIKSVATSGTPPADLNNPPKNPPANPPSYVIEFDSSSIIMDGQVNFTTPDGQAITFGSDIGTLSGGVGTQLKLTSGAGGDITTKAISATSLEITSGGTLTTGLLQTTGSQHLTAVGDMSLGGLTVTGMSGTVAATLSTAGKMTFTGPLSMVSGGTVSLTMASGSLGNIGIYNAATSSSIALILKGMGGNGATIAGQSASTLWNLGTGGGFTYSGTSALNFGGIIKAGSTSLAPSGGAITLSNSANILGPLTFTSTAPNATSHTIVGSSLSLATLTSTNNNTFNFTSPGTINNVGTVNAPSSSMRLSGNSITSTGASNVFIVNDLTLVGAGTNPFFTFTPPSTAANLNVTTLGVTLPNSTNPSIFSQSAGNLTLGNVTGGTQRLTFEALGYTLTASSPVTLSSAGVLQLSGNTITGSGVITAKTLYLNPISTVNLTGTNQVQFLQLGSVSAGSSAVVARTINGNLTFTNASALTLQNSFFMSGDQTMTFNAPGQTITVAGPVGSVGGSSGRLDFNAGTLTMISGGQLVADTVNFNLTQAITMIKGSGSFTNFSIAGNPFSATLYSDRYLQAGALAVSSALASLSGYTKQVTINTSQNLEFTGAVNAANLPLITLNTGTGVSQTVGGIISLPNGQLVINNNFDAVSLPQANTLKQIVVNNNGTDLVNIVGSVGNMEVMGATTQGGAITLSAGANTLTISKAINTALSNATPAAITLTGGTITGAGVLTGSALSVAPTTSLSLTGVGSNVRSITTTTNPTSFTFWNTGGDLTFNTFTLASGANMDLTLVTGNTKLTVLGANMNLGNGNLTVTATSFAPNPLIGGGQNQIQTMGITAINANTPTPIITLGQGDYTLSDLRTKLRGGALILGDPGTTTLIQVGAPGSTGIFDISSIDANVFLNAPQIILNQSLRLKSGKILDMKTGATGISGPGAILGNVPVALHGTGPITLNGANQITSVTVPSLSGGALNLTSAAPLTVSSIMTTNQNVTLNTGTNAIILDNAMSLGTGAFKISSGNVSIGGAHANIGASSAQYISSGTVSLATATNSVPLLEASQSVGSFTYSSAVPVTLKGLTSLGGDISVNAGTNGLTLGGALAATNGTITLDYGNLSLGGNKLTAGQGVTLSYGGTGLTGIGRTGDVSLTQAQLAAISAPNLNIRGGNMAVGPLSFVSLPYNLTLTGAEIDILGNVTLPANKNLTLQATQSVNKNGVTWDSPVVTLGGSGILSVTAHNNIYMHTEVPSFGSIQAQAGNIEILQGQDMYFTKPIHAGGKIVLRTDELDKDHYVRFASGTTITASGGMPQLYAIVPFKPSPLEEIHVAHKPSRQEIEQIERITRAAFHKTFREAVAMDHLSIPSPEISPLFHPRMGPEIQGMMVEDYGLFRVLSDKVPHEVRVVTPHHHTHHKRHHHHHSKDGPEQTDLSNQLTESSMQEGFSGEEASPSANAGGEEDWGDANRSMSTASADDTSATSVQEESPDSGSDPTMGAEDESPSTSQPSPEEGEGQSKEQADTMSSEGEESEGEEASPDAPAGEGGDDGSNADAQDQAGDEKADDDASGDKGDQEKAPDPFELG